MKVYFYFLFLFPVIANSQMETVQWRFGDRAGLSFQNGPPQVIGTSTMFTGYSSACRSDSLGNLLFYVRGGDLIYNKNNDTMANGFNIGGAYTPQSGIIIRKSGSKYYVITHNNLNFFLAWPFPPMTNYAIVDMNLAAGLGSVTVTNQAVSPQGLAMVSKLTATKHCNGKDHWVLTHRGGYPGSNHYYAYLVTSQSISINPVISAIGSNQPQSYAQGILFWSGIHKFSPNGRKLCAVMPHRTVELYDFNNSTGTLSNVIKLDSLANPNPVYDPNSEDARAIEFSPDGTKLYIGYLNNHPHLCQFDLSAGSASAIAASKTIISFDTISAPGYYAPLQLAADGKIYAVNGSSVNLGVINNPNGAGIACNYSPQAVYIGTTATFPYNAIINSSLPNFVSNYFEQKPVFGPINSTIVCGAVNFTAPLLSAGAGYSVISYAWNFNDPISGSNLSAFANPMHLFSANGTYQVKLVLNYYPCGADTLKQNVIITGLPIPSLNGKSTICKNESTVIGFVGANTYSINGLAISQNTAQLQPTVTTVYTLTAHDNLSGCKSLRTFTITVLLCTGIDETEITEGLSIFPNPNKGKFTVSTTLPTEIRISNSIGQEVYYTSFAIGSFEIDLSNISKGIYMLAWKTPTKSGYTKVLVE